MLRKKSVLCKCTILRHFRASECKNSIIICKCIAVFVFVLFRFSFVIFIVLTSHLVVYLSLHSYIHLFFHAFPIREVSLQSVLASSLKCVYFPSNYDTILRDKVCFC